MSNQYPGGFITKSPVAPTTNAASGIWTIDQAMQYIKAGTWPGLPDPYFPYVSMLLPGNGTNGAQNNTFLDSSTNNFTITRNGNTTQGTFSPFSQTGWGNYFDGTGDYLTLASSADFNIFGGDMTLECWFYATNISGRSEHLFAFVQDASNRESLYFNGTTLTFWTSSSAGNGPRITFSNAPTHQWTHVAVTKSGSTFTMYVNGTSAGTSTTTQYSTANQSVQIGTYNNGGVAADSFTGYISNARVVKGTTVYTANFTPSTVPLTAITNTVLLTCQSNRFFDANTQVAAKTITPSGDVSVQAFSPFNPTASWSAATYGGSGYFDGSGDYLSGSSWSTAGNFGTSDFTIEFWAYLTGAPQSNQVIISCNAYPNTTGLYIKYNGGAATDLIVASSSSAIIASSAGWSFNAWHHIAVTRSGSTMTLWIDGVSRGTATFTNNLSDGLQYIGRPSDTANYMVQGYVGDIRFVKGTAVYTAAFTPPTAPLTAITNTSLLLSCTNAGIYDATSKNDLETVGNAQISTTQSKFGGSSMYFDGTGDSCRLSIADNKLQFGTGDFTVEGWVYSTNGTGTYQHIITGGTSWTSGSGGVYWYYGGGSPYIGAAWNQIATNPAVNSGTLATNTWHHFAITRYGNTLTLYVNGLSVDTLGLTGSDSLALNNQSRTNVGGGGWDNDFQGYINDLRITKGYARYTANFTPPTAPFPLQ